MVRTVNISDKVGLGINFPVNNFCDVVPRATRIQDTTN